MKGQELPLTIKEWLQLHSREVIDNFSEKQFIYIFSCIKSNTQYRARLKDRPTLHSHHRTTEWRVDYHWDMVSPIAAVIDSSIAGFFYSHGEYKDMIYTILVRLTIDK